jgi:hypothetical protein
VISTETGASAPQLIVAVGFFIVAIAAVVGGVLLARRQLARRAPGSTVRAQGIALVVGGFGVAVVGLNLLLLAQSNFSQQNVFGRWWFLAPAQPGDWFGGFLGNPGLNLLIVAVFIGWLNLPSLTQLRGARDSIADPAKRGAAIWTIVIVVTLVVGALLGAVVGGLIDRLLVFPGAIVGALVLVVIVVVVASVIINLSNKRKGVSDNE